ncbi:MAG: carbon-nitrogen hydrolase family protein [Acidobacteriota bacterium]
MNSAPRPSKVRVALAQASPVFGDLDATTDRAVDWCHRAAAEGAQLLVFPESWLAGYPAWLDVASDVALWDHGPTQEVFMAMRRQSATVPGPQVDRLCAVAEELSLVVGIGLNERVDAGPGNRTLFNSFLLIDDTGRVAVHHRKLVPTYTEKLVWGPGDGHGLRAASTAAGRIGGLICWEHWMPLPRQRLHDQGEHIHLALWPTVKDLHQLASRHYAIEGRCFVVAVGSILRAGDLPSELAIDLPADDLVLRGGGAVIAPDGSYVLEPLFDEEALRVCEIDLGEIDRHSLTLDTSGHYARRDVLSLDFDPGPPRSG